MKKKTEVYLIMGSEKIRNKAKKLFEMFSVKHTGGFGEWFAVAYDPKFKSFCGYPDNLLEYEKRTQISLKELRSILAAEHLKAGDVVVCVSDGRPVIMEVSHIGESPNGKPSIWGKQCYIVEAATHDRTKGLMYLDEFKRYATEEEKALLVGEKSKCKEWNFTIEADITVDGKPIKELTFNGGTEKPKVEPAQDYTWYYCDDVGEQLIYRTTEAEDSRFKGFINGKWEENLNCSGTPGEWQKATTEQVNAALLAEAQKRYKVGDVVQSLVSGFKPAKLTVTAENYYPTNCEVWFEGEDLNVQVYSSGKWAEIVTPAETNTEAMQEAFGRVKSAFDSFNKAVRECYRQTEETTTGKWVVVQRSTSSYRNAVVYDTGERHAKGFNYTGRYVDTFNIENVKRADWPMREATPQDILEAIQYAQTLK